MISAMRRAKSLSTCSSARWRACATRRSRLPASSLTTDELVAQLHRRLAAGLAGAARRRLSSSAMAPAAWARSASSIAALLSPPIRSASARIASACWPCRLASTLRRGLLERGDRPAELAARLRRERFRALRQLGQAAARARSAARASPMPLARAASTWLGQRRAAFRRSRRSASCSAAACCSNAASRRSAWPSASRQVAAAVLGARADQLEQAHAVVGQPGDLARRFRRSARGFRRGARRGRRRIRAGRPAVWRPCADSRSISRARARRAARRARRRARRGRRHGRGAPAAARRSARRTRRGARSSAASAAASRSVASAARRSSCAWNASARSAIVSSTRCGFLAQRRRAACGRCPSRSGRLR